MPKPSLKTLLKDLEAEDLREVVAELCKLSPQNKTFVELFLRGSDGVDTDALAAATAAKVRACFFTGADRPKKRPDLAEARRLVAEHERLTADYPSVALDAALAYAEAARAYAEALRERHRYVQQATLDAAVRMLERFVRAALARPATAARFDARVEALARLDPRAPRLTAAFRDRDAARLAPEATDEGGDTYRIEYDHRPTRDDDW